MPKKPDKAEILQAVLSVASDAGLSSLTFGRVARRLSINDRTVVYCFPTKADPITDVITTIGLQLQDTIAEAFTAPAATHIELARTAWPVLAHPHADPIFALFFEANGFASAGVDPYQSLISQLIHAWIDWSAEFFTGTTPTATPKPRPPSPSSTDSSSYANSPDTTPPNSPQPASESHRPESRPSRPGARRTSADRTRPAGAPSRPANHSTRCRQRLRPAPVGRSRAK